MKIALVQIASDFREDVESRRARVSDLVLSAAGCDLVVLPELWAVGYFRFDAYENEAEPIDGPSMHAAKEWARKLRCYVHAGSFVERDDRGQFHNTTMLVSPDGAVVHSYRKVHVFGYESREAALLEPGDSVSSAATPLGRIGSTTCYDLRFPEIWRGLVDVGAETVVVPAAWPDVRAEHWDLLTRTRAIENQMFIIAVNAVGVQGDVKLAGHSRVVDPWGHVLLDAGDRESVTSVEIDPSAVARVRREFPVLHDRNRVFVADGSIARTNLDRKTKEPVR